MKPIIACLLCLLPFSAAVCQFTEHFTDGDFTANPSWVGGSTDFIVNPLFQLQSSNTTANSTFYISTFSPMANTAQWEMYVSFTFNPSSANYADVYLTASQSDLTNTGNSGYFVRIGNTDDEVSLYRKDASGTSTKIIDGTNGLLNSSSNTLKFKVVRNTLNQFTLFTDVTGTGNSYAVEGSVTDAVYNTSSYFGILIKQSTASFFQRHFFDDMEVKPYVPDVTPPVIQTITATSINSLDVLFNEPVELLSAQTPAFYTAGNGVGNPLTALRDVANNALVHLVFANSFSSGLNTLLTVNGVKDIAANILVNGTASFLFYVPQRYDVVMDELLADPSPMVSLPNAEFIELKNTSGKPINLQGWKIVAGSSASNLFPSYLLSPDSFVIVTSTAAAASFLAYGPVLGITAFPSLDNTGATLSIVSKENLTIHAVSYQVSWYQNDVKSDGGWTLEMIDTKNACSGYTNWKASTNARGGTPGTKNSIDGTNKDPAPPALKRATVADSLTVVLYFDEPLDSLKAATALNYLISDGIGAPSTAVALPPLFNTVQLKLASPMLQQKIYTITANNVTDCSGNAIQGLKTARAGVPSVSDTFDIIINEVLFNPKAAGTDYVELYNRSKKIIDLKDLFVATRTSNRAIAGLRQLLAESRLFFPGDFFVVSENGDVIKQQYLVQNPDHFINLASMPSLPDESGTIVLLNNLGNIVDELQYDEKWHFALLDNKEGISLERIDYNRPTQDRNNWFSAASTAGYGTPGYQNSQFRANVQLQGSLTLLPKTFSPDQDGHDDYTTINYTMPEPGFAANITIYDANGRMVKVLAQNALLAASGAFRWDGLDDKQRKVSVGLYVIYTEIFNLNGKKRTFKNTVVVAAKF